MSYEIAAYSTVFFPISLSLALFPVLNCTMAFASELGLLSSVLLVFYDGQKESLQADWLLWQEGEGKRTRVKNSSEVRICANLIR